MADFDTCLSIAQNILEMSHHELQQLSDDELDDHQDFLVNCLEEYDGDDSYSNADLAQIDYALDRIEIEQASRD